MDEVREDESAQVGKTRIADILLANSTEGIEEESTQVDNTRAKDILLAETVPLSEGENSGIELAKESEEETDAEGNH